MCTVHSVASIFIVILVGPFISVIVHGPVHLGSNSHQLGLINSTYFPTDGCLPPQPPYACCLLAASTICASRFL